MSIDCQRISIVTQEKRVDEDKMWNNSAFPTTNRTTRTTSIRDAHRNSPRIIADRCTKGEEGFYTVMHRRRICPAFSPESPDDGASGLERQTRSQKCKYRPANQSDWYHSLECPSFTDVYTVAVRHNRRNTFLNRGIVRIRAYICAAMYTRVCTAA